MLRLELSPEGPGTKLLFTTGLGSAGGDPALAARTAAGYHVCLENLQELVKAGRVRVPLVDQPTAQLERLYETVAAEAGVD